MKLSYEQMLSIASELETTVNSMNSLLNTEVVALFNKIGNSDVWSGDAASSAKAEYDAFSAKFPEFIAAVETEYKYLRRVVASYQEGDKAAANR